ncbi:MAG TPA: nuclear transport factor 2 family protein [Caldimonas sp.]
MNFIRTFAALALAAAAPAACAGAADDAQRHLRAIAANNVEALAHDYAEGAVMQWVGGPLNGVYVGSAQLRDLWTRFAKAQGVLELAIAQVEENANPNGATVTSNARFRGNAQTKVRHVLVYRDAKIIAEVWQIDPAMAFAN